MLKLFKELGKPRVSELQTSIGQVKKTSDIVSSSSVVITTKQKHISKNHLVVQHKETTFT